ncbi:hypothetical protein D9M69_479720 [compost metagenome]
MRVRRCLAEIQHRGEAGIAALEQLRPLVTTAGEEQRFQLVAQHRPFRLRPLVLEGRIVDPAQRQQQLVELWLDGADGDELAVGAGVAAVERRAAVEHVALPLIPP